MFLCNLTHEQKPTSAHGQALTSNHKYVPQMFA